MTITPSTLTRAAGGAAVVAGLLFITVQIAHPPVDLAFVTTPEYAVRQTMKVLMAALALAGLTGVYLRQVRQTGWLGLVGYVLIAANYLLMVSVEVAGLAVLPAIAHTSPGYVSDVLAVATGGTAAGDIGLLQTLSSLMGVGYLAGGLVFGVALFRAAVLTRWPAALLAASTVATLAIPLLPQVNQRLFAIPNGVALIGLGYALWRDQHVAARPVPDAAGAPLDPVSTP